MELVVSGADLADGTPIYDIKPYIAYADSVPEAVCGFAQEAPRPMLDVVIPDNIGLTDRQKAALAKVLALDPRPAYQDDPSRIYAMEYDGKDLRFKVSDNILEVVSYGD